MSRPLRFLPAVLSVAMTLASTSVWADLNDNITTTPIKHVIVVIGENHTFDNIYATYQPPAGQTVMNLLSEGIINTNGSAGPNFARARQNQASDPTTYTINPTRTGSYGSWMPQVNFLGPIFDDRYDSLQLINWALTLVGPRNGPFQITQADVPYASPLSVTGSPVHRFFQMWQQTGGINDNLDLYAWVPSQTGSGDNTSYAGIYPTPGSPMQGSEAMGFFNMAAGDAPYLNSLAQQYAMSDNFHQSVMGGTGINFYAISTGGVLPVYNVNGQLAAPPANQIENPNPQSGTNNFYSQDGYSGGSYVNCADTSQPGVASITNLLTQKGLASKCQSSAYYLVNNYNLPYSSTGAPQALGTNIYTFPPQTTPTVADMLSHSHVSWKWYTGGRNLNDLVPTYFPGVATDVLQLLDYNNLGDPLVANTRVMTGPMAQNLQSLSNFYSDVSNGTLPAVTFVVPPGLESGHPGASAPVFYEGFLSVLINAVQAQSSLWKNTAIIITSDEGGGYFDSGKIQLLDFFGDGPRIPLLVVSPYVKKGTIDHSYTDHSSILKFIEKNWSLPTIASNSRDNLPNPVQGSGAYLPSNAPAIGDLSGLFNFK